MYGGLQMKQSMAAAQHAQQAQQASMELAAQQQHQHHQSMAFRQGMTSSGAPFQAPQQEQRAARGLRPSASQDNRDVVGAAGGGWELPSSSLCHATHAALYCISLPSLHFTKCRGSYIAFAAPLVI